MFTSGSLQKIGNWTAADWYSPFSSLWSDFSQKIGSDFGKISIYQPHSVFLRCLSDEDPPRATRWAYQNPNVSHVVENTFGRNMANTRQHCRLNICGYSLVELSNTVFVNSTNISTNIETAKMLLHNAFAIVCGNIYRRGNLKRKEDDIFKQLQRYFGEILKGNDKHLGVPFCKFSWLDKKTTSACVRLKNPDITNPTKFYNLDQK